MYSKLIEEKNIDGKKKNLKFVEPFSFSGIFTRRFITEKIRIKDL
jgi:hypothetical protein